jgi:predicted nuclease with RNAse H fold
VRTLGIDLSASPKKTATCVITWEDGRADVAEPQSGQPDQELIEGMADADWVGIDAPFGWPAEFLEAVTAWADGRRWPPADRARLRYRQTDRVTQAVARLPLSVSSDRIAVTAMRCASLLSALAETREPAGAGLDRTGDDCVVEVYPAAALTLWSDEAANLRFDPQGYKGKAAADRRISLVEALARAAPWLRADDATWSLAITSDDAFDAIICALVARAAAQKLTRSPTPGEETELARVEGWIHLPEPDSLSRLI